MQIRSTMLAFGFALAILGTAGAGCGGESGDTSGDTGADDGADGAEDAGADADAVEDDGADGPTDAVEVEACVPTGPEVCDGIDNDCDGDVDEGFDLLGDDRNCGACGFICVVEGGRPECVDGLCRIADCDDGHLDLNGAAFDGCEYECTASGTAESVDDGTCADALDNDCDGRTDDADSDCAECVPEFCDALDNDCDDLIDEDFDLQTDPVHCGACGVDCAVRPHAVPACIRGECTITCEPGWVDADLDVVTGCETRCTESPSLDETACDGIDADCDGLVDEDYVPDTCGVGECEAEAICWHGVEDCVPLEPGYAEDTACDGLDQDCDGETDEEFVPSSLCRGVCRDTATCTDGVETCGEPAVTDDLLCDGLDEDCDGEVDEDYVPYECGSGTCIRRSTCVGGVEDCIEGGVADEICNGADDDCDTEIDNIAVERLPEVCPPPDHVTATVCESCGAGCGRCAIAADGCEATYHDVNAAYIDGCECPEEATEPTTGSCPDAVRDLGDISDEGNAVEFRGNIVPADDVDWYRFRAVDTSDTSCDQFHVVVNFVSNPGDTFRFDVYRSDSADDCGRRDCEAEPRWYDRYMDFTSGSGTTARGECPCTATNTYRSVTCSNDTQYYFIKVYRLGGTTTCESYTIRASNNFPPPDP